jgi:hypothetical protein
MTQLEQEGMTEMARKVSLPDGKNLRPGHTALVKFTWKTGQVVNSSTPNQPMFDIEFALPAEESMCPTFKVDRYAPIVRGIDSRGDTVCVRPGQLVALWEVSHLAIEAHDGTLHFMLSVRKERAKNPRKNRPINYFVESVA